MYLFIFFWRLYKEFAGEMGFDEFHLYLRPMYFEFATEKEKSDQPPPTFITCLFEDDSSVDRYVKYVAISVSIFL